MPGPIPGPDGRGTVSDVCAMPTPSAPPPLACTCRRFTLLVLDGLGVGAAPDAARWGDERADTLGHVLREAGPLRLPNLLCLGLGFFVPGDLAPAFTAETGPPAAARGVSARLVPLSAGKDSLTGHWELAGLITSEPMRVFPSGLPPALLDAIGAVAGRPALGGEPASGTEIIERLGPEHLATGRLIVYTSADSVIQIAAHEDVIAPERLHAICLAVRELARGPWQVGRVIARTFSGRPGGFARTGRRDYSLPPPGRTVLEEAAAAGVEVVAVGKVGEVFAGRGVTQAVRAGDDAEALRVLRDLVPRRAPSQGAPEGDGPPRLVFANLNDLDSRYGHRRDARGFGSALERLDAALPDLMPPSPSPARGGRRGPGAGQEILALTADHGCDPTHRGTDHTREDVPLLLAGTGLPPGWLGTWRGFRAVAGLVAAAFGLQGFPHWPPKLTPKP